MDRYSSYKDSGIEWLGKIPIHWKLTRIKFTSDISKSSIFTEEMEDQILYHYSIPNIQEIGTGKLEEGNDIDSSKILLKGGEVLISKLNPRKATICVVKEHDALIVGSSEFVSFCPIDIDQNYLYYYFLNQRFTEYLDSSVESVTRSHQRVKPDIIYNSPIYLPPLSEQQRIVIFLDDKNHKINDLIQKKERKIDLLKEKRTALINHVVTKGLDPNAAMKDSGEEWIGGIPRNWQGIRIKHLSKIRYGLGQPPKQKVGGLPIIRATNISGGNISEINMLYVDPDDLPYERNPILRTNDIIVVRSGAYTADSAIIPQEYDGAVTGYDLVVTPVDIDPLFLSYCLLSDYVLNHQLIPLTLRAAQPHLNAEELGSVRIFVPSKEEQKAIVDFINEQTQEIDDLIQLEQKKIYLLKEYRQSIISEVVTGKIRVCEEDHSMMEQTAL